ncbi:LytR/AlgR family response regulator transcription factor [Abyssalbus ytuae]|uniref:LytTR family DNA-binding domain-containing protein n=1 Tax=Abyssalbus ytuae TaxID=2926907 RepID=A0A9E7CSU8_9FLAO|nr:LytTR family DNA-binding domain-containing protein [Abyssalbus ytuae]UOB16886.1 LytTR family DNA-binding domain-containing protein [Abyssalbus ytuae]
MKYPYVIVDNQTQAIDRLKEAFRDYPEYYCVGISGNRDDAVSLILDKSPRLVFLEVEIPDCYNNMSVFSLINELKKYIDTLPEIIVTTTSDQYAIEAIRNGVHDYLLKPLSNNYLKMALLRFSKKQQELPETICVKSHGDYRYVNMNEVLYLKADNNTTDFYMSDGKTIGAYKTLKYFEESLPKYFVRIHNSYIINTNYVTRIHFGKSKFSIKDFTDTIPFSKSYKENVELIKNNLSQQNLLYV